MYIYLSPHLQQLFSEVLHVHASARRAEQKEKKKKKLHYLECNDVITCEKPLFAVFHSLLSDSALLRDVGFLQTCWKPVTAGTSWSPW